MKSIGGVLVVVLLLGAMSGCGSTDPSDSDEYAALEQELAQTRALLTDATEEHPERRDRAATILEEINALLADPEGYGTEEEVADLLATHATPDAMMDDDVFGAVSYRTGFYNTL